MATSPDLPTPLTPDPAELPPEPDRGPTTEPMPQDPASPFTLQPERASAHFSANRSFMRAAAFRWPRFRPMTLIRSH